MNLKKKMKKKWKNK